jgi:cation diffusion facilitator family transporter
MVTTQAADNGNEDNPLKIRMIAIAVSFLVGLTLMGAKFYVYRMTHSSAILSDALESIINVVASAFALVSILMSAIPPDEGHPYGHGKIEFFSAGFEGALIVLAAIGIFVSGISHILYPRHIPRLESGLLILLATAIINLVLGIFLIHTGKRTSSLALVADGKHVLTDVYTSAGVVLGLFFVHVTGWYWMDGVVACVVGINIIVIGGRLVRIAFAGLMDASDPVLLEEVSELLNQHRKEIWIGVHRLRATRSGNSVNIDFHMTLPSYLTLDQAHAEVRELENVIEDHFRGNAHVLIHLDPCREADCPVCSNQVCSARTETFKERAAWDLKAMRRFNSSHSPGDRQ